MERLRGVLLRLLSKDDTKSILSSLAKENALIEKLSLLAFCRRLKKGEKPVVAAADIDNEVRRLIKGGASHAPQLQDLYSHFSSDLLAQLSREYGRKPVYCGFETLIALSQGVPRNLLSLLKHIYRRATFLGEEPFVTNPISVESQVQGIHDAAEWFWDDAQPDAHGAVVRAGVENIATLLRAIRYSDNPSECDLCCFRVDIEKLSHASKFALQTAENWSFLVRSATGSAAKNHYRVRTKFQVNPMLAARWGISESRRGSIDLAIDLAEILFGGGTDEANKAISERTKAMNFPALIPDTSKSKSGQPGLFDD
jgi:hypothetical protein